MVVHDEDTLEEALVLVNSGPVRYDDRYAYIIVTNAETLEERCRSALGRGDIAIVVPSGTESGMEDYTTELRKVKEGRKKQEQKDIKEYFRVHPERVEKVLKKEEKRGKS